MPQIGALFQHRLADWTSVVIQHSDSDSANSSWHTCAQTFWKKIISEILCLLMRKHFTVGVPIGKAVIWGSRLLGDLLEHGRYSLKMNVWCPLTHESRNASFFFDEDSIISNLLLDTSRIMLFRSSAEQQYFSSTGLGSSPIHFAHVTNDCLNVNFPRRCIGRGETAAWPPQSPDFALLNFSWGCVKNKVYNQRENHLGNCYKNMLQHVSQRVNYRWGVCRNTDGADCELFCN
jgi:hypothetical protein